MKYFVYYTMPRHEDSDIQEFDTLEAAIRFVNTYCDGRLLAEIRSGYGRVRLFKGDSIDLGLMFLDGLRL